MEKTSYSDPILDTVYNQIKDDIVEGFFQQGEKLAVRVLCERYHVSDTPVKQALNRLTAEGLVEALPRRGMRVRIFDSQDIQDMFRVRYMIESYCIEECIQIFKKNPGAKQPFSLLIAEHRAFLESLGSQHTAADYLKHQKLDNDFHNLIVQTAGSPRILEIYTSSRTHIYMCQIYRKRGENEMWITFSEHEKLCAELLRCNVEGAKAALRYHIDSLLSDMDKFV